MKTTRLTYRIFAGIFCLGLVLALPAATTYAQRGGEDGRRGDRDRDRERGRDDDRRDRDRGDDRGRSSNEDRRRSFVSRLDRNGDGKIERSEVDSDRWWSYFERSAKDAGLDPSKGVTVENYLRARQVQDRQKMRSENPTAFLEPIDAKPAPGFDQPLTEPELILLNPDKERPFAATTAADGAKSAGERSSGSSSRSSSESSSEGGSDRTERYAKSLMERYDKNGNSILERDEWKDMRGDPEKSDLNNDGRITRDELIKRFSSYRRGSGDGDRQESRRGDDAGDRRDRRSRESDDRESDDATRSSYRFTSALERLPKDARAWIEKFDDNKDGQVAMAEFSSSWSDSKVSEYIKLDLNGDGVVTGAEYLVSKKR